MLTLVWRPAARENLRTIISYIGQRNETAGSGPYGAIEGCGEGLRDHPFLYRPAGPYQ